MPPSRSFLSAKFSKFYSKIYNSTARRGIVYKLKPKIVSTCFLCSQIIRCELHLTYAIDLRERFVPKKNKIYSLSRIVKKGVRVFKRLVEEDVFITIKVTTDITLSHEIFCFSIEGQTRKI